MTFVALSAFDCCRSCALARLRGYERLEQLLLSRSSKHSESVGYASRYLNQAKDDYGVFGGESMILADTRHRLTRDDAQLAARLLARNSGDELAAIESRLSDEGIDAVLDDPRLPAALLRHPRGAHASFTLFAYVMIRHALRQAGESDRGLADYVSAIVLHFGMRDRAYRVSESDDEVYNALVDLVDDVNDPDARRSFLVRTHLGNYALWLSGIFPDYIE